MLIKTARTFQIPFADFCPALSLFIIFSPGNNWCKMGKLGSLTHNTAVKEGTNVGNAIFLHNASIWLIDAGWCFLGYFWEEKGLSSS